MLLALAIACAPLPVVATSATSSTIDTATTSSPPPPAIEVRDVQIQGAAYSDDWCTVYVLEPGEVLVSARWSVGPAPDGWWDTESTPGGGRIVERMDGTVGSGTPQGECADLLVRLVTIR